MGFLDHYTATDVYLALAQIRGGVAAGSVTGTTFWVDNSDSTAMDLAGRGTFSAPLATIDFAIGQCTASRGDTVLVKPGHDESITAASAIDLDVIGVSIIGLGAGAFRPIVRITNTAAYVEVAAANCRIENVRFVNEAASPATAISIGAAGFALVNCAFWTDNSVGTQWVDTISVTANSEDLLIAGNRLALFNQITGSVKGIEVLTGASITRGRITENYIAGSFSVSAISIEETNTLDIEISHNRIFNAQQADIAGVIDLAAGCSGVVAYNHGAHLYIGDLDNAIDGANCALIENYFANVFTEAGGITPQTRST